MHVQIISRRYYSFKYTFLFFQVSFLLILLQKMTALSTGNVTYNLKPHRSRVQAFVTAAPRRLIFSQCFSFSGTASQLSARTTGSDQLYFLGERREEKEGPRSKFMPSGEIASNWAASDSYGKLVLFCFVF